MQIAAGFRKYRKTSVLAHQIPITVKCIYAVYMIPKLALMSGSVAANIEIGTILP